MRGVRAAHFALHSGLVNGPLHDALFSAYDELGIKVDLFLPGGQAEIEGLNIISKIRDVAYGYKWLARHLISVDWCQYSIFSGTTEDPMAITGLLGRVYRRPVITIAQ